MAIRSRKIIKPMGTTCQLHTQINEKNGKTHVAQTCQPHYRGWGRRGAKRGRRQAEQADGAERGGRLAEQRAWRGLRRVGAADVVHGGGCGGSASYGTLAPAALPLPTPPLSPTTPHSSPISLSLRDRVASISPHCRNLSSDGCSSN